ncbi:MAG TPA: glutamate racemase [Candidatus Saccharimonadales bacterium]|nr:glutamate racemase [Candidatus Saccharimonadales bacterium]
MQNFPIGILDSGVGGLSVWQEIISLLPHESTIYICDQKNIPYGAKTGAEIHQLARKLILFLLEKQVKLIIIACNTITVSCLEELRQEFSQVPIIGAVPVVKLAAEVSKKRKIGILSTTRTAESEYQKHIIQTFAQDCTVINEGTDELVPLIERGDLEAITDVLPKTLKPFQEAEVDTLALGCTHYPFIEQKIGSILGKDVHLLDSGAAIARHVQRILEHNELFSQNNNATYAFYTTGDSRQFIEVAKKLLNQAIRDKIGLVESVVV